MRRLALLCTLALAAGCGNHDNQVYGGIASGTLGYPDAAIPDVKSALHGPGNITDLVSGQVVPRWIMILSSTAGLCATLAAHPDYFHDNSTEDYAALILMTPPGLDGDFFLEATNSRADVSLLAAARAMPVVLFPGVSGDVSVTQFDTPGNAKGSFSIYVRDASFSPHAIYGNYKTDYCEAIGSAYLPRSR